MKRFLVFAFDNYYPAGGMNDFIGDSSTLRGAYEISQTSRADVTQIYDTEKIKIVNIQNIILEGLDKYE